MVLEYVSKAFFKIIKEKLKLVYIKIRTSVNLKVMRVKRQATRLGEDFCNTHLTGCVKKREIT